jgi:hypothetical protein
MMFNWLLPRSRVDRAGATRRTNNTTDAMARTPQPLQRILAADPALAAWEARRRREALLTAIVRRHLPRPLAERVRVAEERGYELNLVADAGAIAAVARQRGPDLLAELRREGHEFTSIRVRVQVASTTRATQKPALKQLDRTALRPLAMLARDLPAGPLKTALARFLRRAG